MNFDISRGRGRRLAFSGDRLRVAAALMTCSAAALVPARMARAHQTITPENQPPAAPGTAPAAPPRETPAAAEAAPEEGTAAADAPAAPAAALEATAADPALAVLEEDADTGEGVNEVVVTVEHRCEDLQDRSGNASAFSERPLTRLAVKDLRELAVMVPGLSAGAERLDHGFGRVEPRALTVTEVCSAYVA